MYNMDCFFLQNICEITKCTTYLCADLMRYNHLSTLRTIVILINSFQNINLTNQLTHKTSFAIKLLLYWFIIILFYSLSQKNLTPNKKNIKNIEYGKCVINLILNCHNPWCKKKQLRSILDASNLIVTSVLSPLFCRVQYNNFF